MPEDIRRMVSAVVQLWNTGDPKVAEELYSDGAQRYDPNRPEPTRGSQGILNYVVEVRVGFPDFNLEIDETVVEGNRMVSHWTCTGTHKGEFDGIPATGKRITISGLDFARIENGKISEERVYFDRLAMLEQLGVAPDMRHAEAQAVR